VEEGTLKINSQCGLRDMELVEGIVMTIVEGVEDIVGVIEMIEMIAVIIEAADVAATVEGIVVVAIEVASEEDGEVVSVAATGVATGVVDTEALDIVADSVTVKEVLQADLLETSLPVHPLALPLEAMEVGIKVATAVELTVFLLGEE
jgi:hypothetical protein